MVSLFVHYSWYNGIYDIIYPIFFSSLIAASSTFKVLISIARWAFFYIWHVVKKNIKLLFVFSPQFEVLSLFHHILSYKLLTCRTKCIFILSYVLRARIIIALALRHLFGFIIDLLVIHWIIFLVLNISIIC